MKSHAFDPLSFLAGLLFAVLGVVGAAGVLDDAEKIRAGWPLVFVVFGVLLVGSTIRRGGSDAPAAGPLPENLDPEHGLGSDPATSDGDLTELAPSAEE